MPVPPEREQLAGLLASLRAAAKRREKRRYSSDALASRLADELGKPYHFTRVSRVEHNAAAVGVEEALAWARDCGANDTDLARVRELATIAQDTSEVWTPDQAGNIPAAQRTVGAREQGARDIRVFGTAAVNGLAQTPEYAHALFTKLDIADVTAAVAERLARQVILGDPGHRFTLLHTEGAIRWRPGTRGLLDDQLGHLIEVSRRGNVRVGILPHDIEAPAPYESRFAIYDDWTDGSAPVVEAEHALGEVVSTRPSIVERYQRRFALLEASALFDDQARDFLERVRRELAG